MDERFGAERVLVIGMSEFAIFAGPANFGCSAEAIG
jgi:hypothetical protein